MEYKLLEKDVNGNIIDNFATVWQTLPFTFTLTQEGYVSFTGRKSDNSNSSNHRHTIQLGKHPYSRGGRQACRRYCGIRWGAFTSVA